MPTPEERRNIIQQTGLCLNENCTAHDGIIDRIQGLMKLSAHTALVEKRRKRLLRNRPWKKDRAVG